MTRLIGTCASAESASGSNIAKFCYQPYEDLVLKAKTVTNPAERIKLYQQAQVIFKDQAPWATIAHSLVSLPMSTKVSGYLMDPLGSHRFDGVDITE